jgi:hypothetical protein
VIKTLNILTLHARKAIIMLARVAEFIPVLMSLKISNWTHPFKTLYTQIQLSFSTRLNAFKKLFKFCAKNALITRRDYGYRPVVIRLPQRDSPFQSNERCFKATHNFLK